MNIFKILSSGDQKLKEPAVTSFIAFLLDPYESHGLKTKFLEYFLKPIVENLYTYETYKDLVIKMKDQENKDYLKIKSNLIDDFNFNIEIEVSKLLVYEDEKNEEQEEGKEKNSKKRNDIDIVIEIESKNNDESKYSFIVENKINDRAISGKNGEQLIEQRDSFLKELERKEEQLNRKVCSIFLTPKSNTSNKYFEEFKNGVNGKFEEDSKKNPDTTKPIYHHHYWKEIEESKETGSAIAIKLKTDTANFPKSLDEIEKTIKKIITNLEETKKEAEEKQNAPIVGVYNILNDILSKESVGLIEPLQDYTKHTIKAFMNYIDTGFKSRSDEKGNSEANKKKYYDSIDEVLQIWKLDHTRVEMIKKIIKELNLKDDEIKYSIKQISFKNKQNFAVIKKPPINLKHLPCVIMRNKNSNYSDSYKLNSNGNWQVAINIDNIEEFICHLKILKN